VDITFDLAKVNDGVLYMLGGSAFKVCRARHGVKLEVRPETPRLTRIFGSSLRAFRSQAMKFLCKDAETQRHGAAGARTAIRAQV
jgi:hypothetical protein